MKRILLSALCTFILLLSAGCSNYSDVQESLDNIKIENELPELSNMQYLSLESANDEIYAQQIAACRIFAETYNETYYENFYEKGMKRNKVANMCTTYRKEVNNDTITEFYKNLYIIVKDCDDCTNKDAFVEKAGNDVLGFFDAYDKYINAEDQEIELCNILNNFSERKNILALSFLEKNRHSVFEAATNMIEENADAEESYRYYLNKNNYIVSSLNDVYDGVPTQYANRISDATRRLSVNLLNSLDKLTETERQTLMEQLDLITPSPSPEIVPKNTPVAQLTPVPSVTLPPARTIAPATQAPIRTATPTPVVVTPKPQATKEPTPVEDEPDDDRPSYNFSVNE